MVSEANGHSGAAFDPYAITRPDKSLLRYYLIGSALLGPFFPFMFVPLWCKYTTLRYRFDDKGVSMAWGVLFRRETYLTYRRIQDIHVSRGIIQRWLGLAKISVQTASGASGAEMAIEGILEPELLRDFLYSQMRGARGEDEPGAEGAPELEAAPADEALALLREIRDELRARRPAGGGL